MSAWNASGEGSGSIKVRKMAGYKNNSPSNAHSRQRPVDQIYLCGKVQSHRSQPLYRVRARLKPSLRSALGNFGTRLTQTAPLERISPDKSACGKQPDYV